MSHRQDSPYGKGQKIFANGLEIYYREHGSGQPLILIHGATDTHHLWDPFLPQLTENFRVITPDSRGHGRSFNPEDYLTYPMLADDLAGLIQALDLDQPFVFGYSDGGQAALDFGMRYPDQAGALVIGGAWYRFSSSYQQAISAAGFPGPGKVDYQLYASQAQADWEERLRNAHPDPRPDYPRILLETLSRLWWTPLNYREGDFLKIKAPSLVLMGELDEMISSRQAVELADLIPGGALALIPDAGHNEVLVEDGVFLDRVLKFFKSIQE